MSSSKAPALLSKTPAGQEPGDPGGCDLTLRGTCWIAADIHLGPHNPATCRAFYDFLRQAQTHCDALILCGDIFHVWVGDDQIDAPEPWQEEAIQAMQAFSRTTPLYLMRGNRDFLLGQTFARHVGARLLPDGLRVVIQADGAAGADSVGGAFWLTHGDELCTQDRHYQRFRRWVRKRMVQRLFLACPLRGRRAMAHWLRRRSQRAGARKNTILSDVHPAACQRLLAQQRLRILVHGHTHRPAMHHGQAGQAEQTEQTAGQAADQTLRIVLPDWELDSASPPGSAPRSGWLCVDARGLTLHQSAHKQTLAFGACVPVSTTALVLAAGSSRRMGTPNKLLLPVNGQPMIRRVLEEVVQAVQACGNGGQIIVVLGHQAAPVQAALHGLPLRFVSNPDYAQGMGSSLRAGAHHVPAGHAVLVCLGDMPALTAEVIQAVIQAGQAAHQQGLGIAACQPVCTDEANQAAHAKRGHPVWWAPEQLATLRSRSGDAGARALLQTLHQEGRVQTVPVHPPTILHDIDTPQAWQAFLQTAL